MYIVKWPLPPLHLPQTDDQKVLENPAKTVELALASQETCSQDKQNAIPRKHRVVQWFLFDHVAKLARSDIFDLPKISAKDEDEDGKSHSKPNIFPCD